MSTNLSRIVEPFVTSVVVGKDVVPRVSVVNLGRLIDQMVRPELHFHPLQCFTALPMPSLAVRRVSRDKSN
jgi:hypothetical protein